MAREPTATDHLLELVRPTPDPLIASLELVRPIDAAVLDAAIQYREALVDQLVGEIDVLKVTRARMLNAPAGG